MHSGIIMSNECLSAFLVHWHCPFPYEHDDEDSSDNDDEEPLIQSAWLDTQEEQIPTDDHKKFRKSTKAKTPKIDSQIGWNTDISESAERTFTRTGRTSRLPLRLRPEIYGRPEEVVESGDVDVAMEEDD